MRVLVTVNDAFGHVLPLLPAVRELARRGHDVLVACPGDTVAATGLDGVRTARYDAHVPPPPVPPPPREARAARLDWAVRTSWPNAARGWAPALLADARTLRPDVVLGEPCEYAGRVVAAALGVPFVEHGWGFTLPAGVDVDANAGLSDLYDRLGATPVAPALRVDLGPDLLQAADAEPGVHRFRHTPWRVPAQPLPPPGSRPRVLLSLGTFPHPDAAGRLRTAATAVDDLDTELVVVLGHDDRGDGRQLPPGARVVRWLDLPGEVGRCALVLHHAGAGTALSTATAGVPAVCLPQAGDQFRNAELLARVGAAVVVDPDDLDASTVRKAAAAALADGALTRGAGAVRAANACLPPVAALAQLVEQLG